MHPQQQKGDRNSTHSPGKGARILTPAGSLFRRRCPRATRCPLQPVTARSMACFTPVLINAENVLVNRIIRFFLLVDNKPDLPGQASLNRISRFVSFAHPRHVAIEREGKAATSSRVQDRISLQRRKRIAARSARVRDENAAVSSVRRCVRGNMALRSHRPGRRIGQRWEPT